MWPASHAKQVPAGATRINGLLLKDENGKLSLSSIHTSLSAIPAPARLSNLGNRRRQSAAQVWQHRGGGIDGFRLYDAYQGIPFVIKTEANRDIP